MIRKTLEDFCDVAGASGNNLKQRVQNLGSHIVIPQPILDALDDVRLLGNDAAHVNASTYNQIGEDEVMAGFDLLKMLLHAHYQLPDFASRLKRLKKND